MNGDVWVHGNFAYVGTWAIPCGGTGVRIVDVSDLRNPELIATAGGGDGDASLPQRVTEDPPFAH